MAYIGQSPSIGEFRKLDDISGQFNDSNTTFALTVNSSSVVPGSEQALLISIDGVLQEPGTAYFLSGTNLVFTAAPNTSSTFFGIQLGSVGQVGVPTDGTVTSAKLAANAVTLAKIATNAVDTGQLVNGAVTSAKIVNGAVTGDKLDVDAVTTTKILNGAVTTAKIASVSGTGNVVLSISPTIVTPNIGTPSFAVLTNATVDGTDAVGFRNIPQNIQNTAYTLVLTDAGKHILHPVTDNNARTFTIPDNGNVAYPVGTALTFINRANTVTIAITIDTLIFSPAGTTGSRTLAANGSATCIKTDSTEWLISGSGLT